MTIADATEHQNTKYCSGPDWMFVENPYQDRGFLESYMGTKVISLKMGKRV